MQRWLRKQQVTPLDAGSAEIKAHANVSMSPLPKQRTLADIEHAGGQHSGRSTADVPCRSVKSMNGGAAHVRARFQSKASESHASVLLRSGTDDRLTSSEATATASVARDGRCTLALGKE
ncbi:hypothetical protein MRX96_006540 [Rhipicephalus microplus]